MTRDEALEHVGCIVKQHPRSHPSAGGKGWPKLVIVRVEKKEALCNPIMGGRHRKPLWIRLEDLIATSVCHVAGRR